MKPFHGVTTHIHLSWPQGWCYPCIWHHWQECCCTTSRQRHSPGSGVHWPELKLPYLCPFSLHFILISWRFLKLQQFLHGTTHGPSMWALLLPTLSPPLVGQTGPPASLFHLSCCPDFCWQLGCTCQCPTCHVPAQNNFKFLKTFSLDNAMECHIACLK